MFKRIKSRKRRENHILIHVDGKEAKDAEIIKKEIRNMLCRLRHITGKEYSYELLICLSQNNSNP